MLISLPFVIDDHLRFAGATLGGGAVLRIVFEGALKNEGVGEVNGRFRPEVLDSLIPDFSQIVEA